MPARRSRPPRPATGGTAPAHATPRQPRQERGERRVAAILDAAAELVAEHGVAGLTMQAVARRSRTASGSLYHFFPDRESVLAALAERHARALRELATAIQAGLADSAGNGNGRGRRSRPAAEPVEALVNRFLDPLLDYLRDHPEFLAVAEATAASRRLSGADVDLDAAVQSATEHLVRACDPGATRGTRAARAAAVSAALEGTMARLARSDDARARSALVRELKRLLVAYLAGGAGARRT